MADERTSGSENASTGNSGSDKPSGEQWATRIGVILAVAGSAVGLGNFLRFPGQAAQNGGGAFMLPYFISLLILGIPLCWAEWTMGRYGGLRGFNSAPGIYASIWRNRAAKYFGSIALLLPLVVYMYYVLIEAWCLMYALNYLTGDLVIGAGGEVDELIKAANTKATEPLDAQKASSAAFGDYFAGMTGQARDGAAVMSQTDEGQKIHGDWLAILAGTFVFNFILVYRGVSKGIETFCRVAMPMMVVLALIVLCRVLTLPTLPENQGRSVLDGLGFMWNPKSEALANPQTWLAASGQIFFSLSVGFGIIINYSSYLRRNDDVVLSGLTSSSMNEFFEVCLGGLITLPAAFIFLGAAAGEQGTFGLGFVALPNVFASMWGGRFFGFLWFFMLFIAAITSSVSMLQPVIAFFEEGFGLKRHASSAVLGFIALTGCAFVMYFSKGLLALDTFDFWVGTLLIYILAMFQAVLYGWIFGIKRGEIEAHKGAHIRIPRFVQYMLKYVVPVYLIVIFIAFCYSNIPSKRTLAFETNANTSDALAAGNLLPDELTAGFKANELKAPDAEHRKLTIKGDEWTLWSISDDGGEVLPEFTMKRVERNEILVVKKDGNEAFRTEVIGSRPRLEALQKGKLTGPFREEIKQHGLELPKEVAVESTADGAWVVESVGKEPVRLLEIEKVVAAGPGEVLAVSTYGMGYAEKVYRRPTMLMSVAFIMMVLGLLLLLIRIAGKRWEKQGRFNRLDVEHEMQIAGGDE